MAAITAEVGRAGQEQGPAVVAAWVWVSPGTPAAPLARFARARGLREAYVSVPWLGPDDDTRAMVGALRAAGVEVHALGGECKWALDPDRARTWAGRAHAQGLFTGTHLDVEAWTLPDWANHAEALLAGVARAAAAVTQVSPGPPDVDVAPWAVDDAPAGFDAVARAARGITFMSYRNTAERILRFSASARSAMTNVRRSYRLAVDTLPNADPSTTFAGRPASVLRFETDAVLSRLRGDPHFHGIAVHDLLGWSRLPRSGPGPVHHC